MSAEQFWKDDPQLFVSYRTSFLNKKQREMEELDYKCWLQGLYIHDGNGKLTSSLKQFLGNMFSNKKDKNPIDTYPKKPYMELEKDKKQEELEKKKKISCEQFRQDFIYYGTMKQRYLEKLKREESEKNGK